MGNAKKIRSVLIVVAAVAGTAAALALLAYAFALGKAYVAEQIAIDRCADAGGAWDRPHGTCRR